VEDVYIMRLTPRFLRILLNLYGPFFGAGVKVEEISRDWLYLRVSMQLRWYNRNILGVHFGGSLYSMVDPHLVLLYMQLLGSNYVVWDKAAAIRFKRPGKGKVQAEVRLGADDIDAAVAGTEGGKTYEPSHDIEIIDERGKVIASVRKDLYIRKKQ
jgi:hypothetical protein